MRTVPSTSELLPKSTTGGQSPLLSPTLPHQLQASHRTSTPSLTISTSRSPWETRPCCPFASPPRITAPYPLPPARVPPCRPRRALPVPRGVDPQLQKQTHPRRQISHPNAQSREGKTATSVIVSVHPGDVPTMGSSIRLFSRSRTIERAYSSNRYTQCKNFWGYGHVAPRCPSSDPVCPRCSLAQPHPGHAPLPQPHLPL